MSKQDALRSGASQARCPSVLYSYSLPCMFRLGVITECSDACNSIDVNGRLGDVREQVGLVLVCVSPVLGSPLWSTALSCLLSKVTCKFPPFSLVEGVEMGQCNSAVSAPLLSFISQSRPVLFGLFPTSNHHPSSDIPFIILHHPSISLLPSPSPNAILPQFNLVIRQLASLGLIVCGVSGNPGSAALNLAFRPTSNVFTDPAPSCHIYLFAGLLEGLRPILDRRSESALHKAIALLHMA